MFVSVDELDGTVSERTEACYNIPPTTNHGSSARRICRIPLYWLVLTMAYYLPHISG